MHGRLAGHLERIGSRVQFQYDAQYLKIGSAISMSLPLRSEPYESEGLCLPISAVFALRAG
ncbi:HipA N-terminal domain-containing protein [Marinobacter antarcticus]|uniref:HipA N-terminal domain-containing protein n=1 Tax=Marinobacter antarcticus TaxID=564117 RepID=UPI003899078C